MTGETTYEQWEQQAKGVGCRFSMVRDGYCYLFPEKPVLQTAQIAGKDLPKSSERDADHLEVYILQRDNIMTAKYYAMHFAIWFALTGVMGALILTVFI